MFERSLEAFTEYDDHPISFTDDVVSAHAFARDATVYTFDTTDFSILGNDVVLRWTE